ncbi:MAG: cation diffusion facilitator family transporter [Bacteroidetes bacterium]|nr:cation diffusion facilitator family transporter [Bacteroidota bacterium]
MNTKELFYIRLSFFVSLLLCGVKFFAWYVTDLLVILSDALESIINVVGSAFAWYSIYLSAKPRDKEHPYGHGKIEFFSIGFEGAMILLAGILILFEAVHLLIQPQQLQESGFSFWLMTGTGIANLLLGYLLVNKGKRFNSVTLKGNGRHIMSDSYTSIGVVIAIGLIYFTHIQWIDPVASIVAGSIIVVTGFRLLRKSISGLMDEADPEMVQKIIQVLNKNRKDTWIDIHNLRVQRYGNFYHVDCHITLPFYYSLTQVHDIISEMDKELNSQFEGGSIEFFMHTDPCMEYSCPHCKLSDCKERKRPFAELIPWDEANLLPNKRHAFPE